MVLRFDVTVVESRAGKTEGGKTSRPRGPRLNSLFSQSRFTFIYH